MGQLACRSAGSVLLAGRPRLLQVDFAHLLATCSIPGDLLKAGVGLFLVAGQGFEVHSFRSGADAEATLALPGSGKP